VEGYALRRGAGPNNGMIMVNLVSRARARHSEGQATGCGPAAAGRAETDSSGFSGSFLQGVRARKGPAGAGHSMIFNGWMQQPSTRSRIWSRTRRCRHMLRSAPYRDNEVGPRTPPIPAHAGGNPHKAGERGSRDRAGAPRSSTMSASSSPIPLRCEPECGAAL